MDSHHIESVPDQRDVGVTALQGLAHPHYPALWQVPFLIRNS